MKRSPEMMWYRNRLVPVRDVEEMARKAMSPVDRIYEIRMARGDREGALTALVEPFGGRRTEPKVADDSADEDRACEFAP